MSDHQPRESVHNIPKVWGWIAMACAGLLIGLAFNGSHLTGARWISQPTQPDTVHQAHLDLERGEDAAAIRLLRTLVKNNDPDAQYWLGYMTELGLGTTRDVQKAVELYRAAADQNVVAAQLRLGEIYLHGNLVPPDSGLAKTYLERAAYQGEPRAAMLVGQMYRVGIGAAPDLTKAYAWSEVATIEGSAFARKERDASLRGLDAQDQQSAVARAKMILAKVQRETASLRSPAGRPGEPAPPMRKASETPNA